MLTVLEPIDDAAFSILGSGARTPTIDEWEELINSTSLEEFTLNGVKGYKLTASNGNSIFLPAAGYKYGESLVLTDNLAGRPMGYYWSSSYAYAEYAHGITIAYSYPISHGNA